MWWLAHRIVRLRCGGSRHLYEQWRRNVEEGADMTEVERKILRSQLTENLGLPACDIHASCDESPSRPPTLCHPARHATRMSLRTSGRSARTR